MEFKSIIFLYQEKELDSSKTPLRKTNSKYKFWKKKEIDCIQPQSDIFQPELHLNIWESESGFHNDCYLDIGLMISTKNNVDKFTLILPWKVAQKDIVDLSDELTGNIELQAVFNDSYSFTNRIHDGGHIARHMFNPKKFFNIIASSNNYIKKSGSGEFSHFDIDINKLKETSSKIDEKSRDPSSQMYVRFRILKMPEDFYCRITAPKDSWFRSSITTSQIIDVRVNVRRDVPVNLLSKLSLLDMKFISFKKIHLFLMKPQEDSLVFNDSYFKACRSLENVQYWEKYSTRKSKSIERNLGYQWTYKCNNPENDDGWTVLARFQRIKLTIKRYFIFFMIAGVVGGVFGNMIYTNWDAIWDKIYVTDNHLAKSDKDPHS